MLTHARDWPVGTASECTRPSGSALRFAGFVAAVFALLVVALLSLRWGSIGISTQDAWSALWHYDPTNYHEIVVRSLRLPRTVIAIAVGGGLGAAGAVAQAITRNPLAEPSILGISNGAGLGIVVAVYLFHRNAANEAVWFGFAGAVLASIAVISIGSAGKGGTSPVKLALAGVIVAWLLSAWTSALLLLDRETMDTVRFWLAGSVAGRELNSFWPVAPFLLGGTAACALLGRHLNVLSLGDDTARALGMHTTRFRVLAFGLIVAITGSAVAIAGPIAFVGLATPHIVRSLVGPDYRWVIPFSIVVGAIMLTVADIIGRLAVRPAELQVGIVTALIGAPFLIHLARQRSIAS